MRPIRTAVLAAAAAAGLGGAAIAASDTAHLMLVRLPDGSVERIRYTGDVAPRIVLVPRATLVAFAGPFAMMARISAAMDARAAAMMRQAATIATRAPLAGGMSMASGGVSAGAMPVGTQSYSVVSTTINGRTCTRSTRLIVESAGAQPKPVSQSSGDCAAPAQAPALTARPAPAAAQAKVTPVRLELSPRRVAASRPTV